MELPGFRYHPYPLATGSVVESDATCAACGKTRGYVYTGPVYMQDEPEALCPWCIADGTAAETFGAELTDFGVGVPDDVPREVLEELAFRTPGFSGWQQEHWLYHCGDAAEFHGVDDREATTYRFRCRHCGTDLTYSDSA